MDADVRSMKQMLHPWLLLLLPLLQRPTPEQPFIAGLLDPACNSKVTGRCAAGGGWLQQLHLGCYLQSSCSSRHHTTVWHTCLLRDVLSLLRFGWICEFWWICDECTS
jgi:hypothetical protein